MPVGGPSPESGNDLLVKEGVETGINDTLKNITLNKGYCTTGKL